MQIFEKTYEWHTPCEMDSNNCMILCSEKLQNGLLSEVFKLNLCSGEWTITSVQYSILITKINLIVN